MSDEPNGREVWIAVVRAGRSKFTMSALALMFLISIWEFLRGNIAVGFAVLAITALTLARVPAAVAIVVALSVRKLRGKSSPPLICATGSKCR